MEVTPVLDDVLSVKIIVCLWEVTVDRNSAVFLF